MYFNTLSKLASLQTLWSEGCPRGFRAYGLKDVLLGLGFRVYGHIVLNWTRMWLLWPAQRNEFVLSCTGWVSVLLCKNAKDLSLSWIFLSCSLCWNVDLYYFLTELENSLICAVQLVGVWGTDLNVVDKLLVDGGMVWFEVVEKIGIDVKVLVHWLWAGSDMCHSNLLAWRLHCRGKEFSAPHYFFKVLFFLIVTLSAVHLPQSIWLVQFSATCHQCVLRSFEWILVKFK